MEKLNSSGTNCLGVKCFQKFYSLGCCFPKSVNENKGTWGDPINLYFVAAEIGIWEKFSRDFIFSMSNYGDVFGRKNFLKIYNLIEGWAVSECSEMQKNNCHRSSVVSECISLNYLLLGCHNHVTTIYLTRFVDLTLSTTSKNDIRVQLAASPVCPLHPSFFLQVQYSTWMLYVPDLWMQYLEIINFL